MDQAAHVITSDNGTDHVEVIADGALVRQFVPYTDGSSVTFCELLDDRRLAVLDERGRLRLYDLRENALFHEHDFRSDIGGCGAVLAPDRRTLYLTTFMLGARLVVYDLQRLELRQRHELPTHAETKHFWIDPAGRLLFYILSGSWDDADQHQSIHRLDPATGAGEDFPLAAPPPEFFDRKLPVFDFIHGYGIRRYYEVVVADTPEGPRFVNQVAVFDLETFTDRHLIATREYPPGQLGYGPSDEPDNAVAQILAAPADTGAYHHERGEFVDDLRSIHPCTDSPAFWVCFRDGILRRLALDGSARSALVGFDRLPGREAQDPFARKYFHASIRSDLSRDNHIVVTGNHVELAAFDPTALDLADEHALITVTPEPVDPPSATRSPAQAQQTEDLDRTVIPVADLDDPAAILTALDDLVARCADIDALRRGHSLLLVFREASFRGGAASSRLRRTPAAAALAAQGRRASSEGPVFCDPAGEELDEDAFFARAVELDGGPERIATLLRRFIAFPGHEDLYRDEETCALSGALHALVLHDARWLDLYADYYHQLDVEHDVFNHETMLPAIFTRYAWSPPLLRLLAVLELVDGEAAAHYGNDPALARYLADDAHLQILVTAIRERVAQSDHHYDPGEGAGSPVAYRRLLAERFAAMCAQADAAHQQTAALIAQATALGTAGDWTAALPLLAEAVEVDPTDVDACNLHAYALMATGDPAAPAALAHVLELDPANAAALANLALWHYSHGEEDAGATAYARFFATAPPLETLYHCYLSDVHGAEHPGAAAAAERYLALATAREPDFAERALDFGQLANERAQCEAATQTGQCAAVLDLARAHCERVKAFHADEPAHISAALHLLGSVLEGAGAYQEAIAAYQAGADIDQAGGSVEAIDWASAALKHNAIAECYRKAGDFSSCRQYYQLAIDQGQTAWGERHANLAVFHANQAMSDLQLGLLDQAESGFATALAMAEDCLGADHPGLATMLINYATLRSMQGHPETAVTLSERAVANETAAYGADHPATAESRAHLAEALLACGRIEPARAAAAQAHAALTAAHGDAHPAVATVCRVLGRIALHDDDAETAVEHLHQAMAVLTAAGGADTADGAELRAELGRALLCAGEPAAAAAPLAEAYVLYSGTIGMQHPAVPGILRDRARALLATDDTVGAAEALMELRRTAAQQDQPALEYEAAAALTLVYCHAGLAAEAAKHRDTAVELAARLERAAPLHATPLCCDLVEDQIASGEPATAFALHAALHALADCGADGDLPAAHARDSEQLALSHITHALGPNEVFASTLPDCDRPTAVFLVDPQHGLTLHAGEQAPADLAAVLIAQRPQATLVDVATMRERTSGELRKAHEQAATEHGHTIASLADEGFRLQAEMQERISAAMAAGRYADIAAITAEYTEKLTRLGEDLDA